MIESRLDNDLYIFTMWYAMEKLGYGDTPVEYTFVNRSGIDLLPLKDRIEEEVGKLCSLKFDLNDVHYLERLHFLGKGSMDSLFDDMNIRKLKRENINIYEENGELNIKVKGPWRETIWFEVPVLSIISGVYHENIESNAQIEDDFDFKYDNLERKAKMMNKYDIKVADFGTRRRASFDIQEEVVSHMSAVAPFNFVGTSNVHLARKYDVRPIGTMAHQWLQFFQAITYNLEEFQLMALEEWMHVYRGNLGIALTDTVGVDAFLKDFDIMLAKLYDGVRHDSGDPYEFGEKVIKHYRSLGIDPMTKTIVFSDSLYIGKAKDLHERFSDRINVSFGIGTNLTNDCGYKPLSIVIKLSEADGVPVAKISDEPNKAICKDPDFLDKLMKTFNVRRT